MIRKFNDSLTYIGTDDYSEPKFESQYAIPDGMAYNSWLIKDTKTAIMDSCDRSTADAWRKNLQEARTTDEVSRREETLGNRWSG